MRNRAAGLRVVALCVSLAAQPAASTTFTVNSIADNSDALLTGGVCDTGYKVELPAGTKVTECTLRAAIQQANHTTGADTIGFAIPGRT